MKEETKNNIILGAFSVVVLFYGWSYLQYKNDKKKFPFDCRWSNQFGSSSWKPFTQDFPYFSAARQNPNLPPGHSTNDCSSTSESVTGTTQQAVKKSLNKE